MSAITIARSAVDLDLLSAIEIGREVHGLPASGINEDEGLVVSTALAAAFGGHSGFRPWRATRRNGKAVTIVGNGSTDDLVAALDRASPASQRAVLQIRASDPVVLSVGRYRFDVRICPTRKATGTNRERDAYLHEVEKHGSVEVPRETVYARWLAERLDGATVNRLRMDGFTLARAFRPTRERRWVANTYPDATFTGVLTIDDPARFGSVVTGGVGRQSAYGFGWMWLERIV